MDLDGKIACVPDLRRMFQSSKTDQAIHGGEDQSMQLTSSIFNAHVTSDIILAANSQLKIDAAITAAEMKAGLF